MKLYDADGELSNTTVKLSDDPSQLTVTSLKTSPDSDENGYHFKMKGLNISVKAEECEFKGFAFDHTGSVVIDVNNITLDFDVGFGV